MKITELKCPACGALLKINDPTAKIAKCAYCDTQFTLEWDNKSAPAANMPQRTEPKPAPPAVDPTWSTIRKTRQSRRSKSIWGTVVLLIFWGVMLFGRLYRHTPSGTKTTPTWEPPASAETTTDLIESLRQTPSILKDFAEILYGRPMEDISEEELARIQWLETKSDLDYKQVGYSFENPLDNPNAELTWIKFPRDSYSDISMDLLPAFTGLKVVNTGQRLREDQLTGLTLQGIGGYYDSLETVAALTEHPEAIRSLDISGSAVSLNGIELFPNLEILMIDSDNIGEERLLVNAASLKTLYLDMYSGSIDFSILEMIPGLEDLTIICPALKDIGFVSKIAHLKALRLERGSFLNLDPLTETPELTELSILDCNDVNDMSAVSTLTNLTKLTLDMPYSCPQPDLDGLTGIETLRLEGYEGSVFLKHMDSLSNLTLVSCTPGDLSDFTGLNNLKTLKCISSAFSDQDYSFIPALPALEDLDLHGTSTYGDISGIFNMPTLKRLNLNGMKCEIDFDKIKDNTTLETLFLDNITLYENVVITGGGGIYSINMDDVELTEHLDDFLGRLKGLKNLSICENKLPDIEFAASLETLQSIDFSDNYVTELTPLTGLKNLQTVNCAENPISNYDVLGESVIILR